MDLGNTRLKWGYKSEKGDWANGAFSLNPQVAFESELNHLLMLNKPSMVLISSVVSRDVNAVIKGCVQDKFGVELHFIKAEREFLGVTAAYQNLDNLGVDRWLALLVAHNSSLGSKIILSAGTALTVDYLCGIGKHLGGLILPGFASMQEALFKKAGNIDQNALTLPQNWRPGCDTLDCIENGFSALFSSLFKEVINPKNELVEKLDTAKIIITGGNADLIQHFVPQAFLHKYIVLEGMWLYANEKGFE